MILMNLVARKGDTAVDNGLADTTGEGQTGTKGESGSQKLEGLERNGERLLKGMMFLLGLMKMFQG